MVPALFGGFIDRPIVRAVVKLEKEQQIKASCKTFFACRSTVDREYRVFGCVEDMKTKRLLRLFSGVWLIIPITLRFVLPEKNLRFGSIEAPKDYLFVSPSLQQSKVYLQVLELICERAAIDCTVMPVCRRQSLSASPGGCL
jgi:hypothetical protein